VDYAVEGTRLMKVGIVIGGYWLRGEELDLEVVVWIEIAVVVVDIVGVVD